MLFCLDRLMKTVGKTTSRHDTTGKLINDHDLIIAYHIILILKHQVMCTQRKDDIVLDLHILRIRKVRQLEETLHLRHARFRQVNHLIFFIDNEISRLLTINLHDRIHLGNIFHILSSLHLLCKDIAYFIKLCGFTALSGNDQRSTRLVDQYRIDLVDDRVMKSAQHQLFLIDDHIVTKIIKTKLIVGNICDITCIRFPSFL